MFLYQLSYVVRKPLVNSYKINYLETEWRTIVEWLESIYKNGGEFIVEKVQPVDNDGLYVEFREVTGFIIYDRYSFVCDPRYGYLLACSIDECERYPQGGYFSLLNNSAEKPTEVFVFSPYDDEWEAQYVNQDFSIALYVFREIYDNGELSEETLKKWFTRTF
ncbi:hypothetical protein MMO38_04940 [Acinetobacter sp. NIPH 1852]|uniref:hypothetical protein n=1 Tax=Acinetobacter sp. NIPH 1852 TaxID=2923428 RepID=UPI001B456233|nr:hypothetical protein [Acinetobacter sp. NIPH 1852]MBP8006517.1 hypothetical protein [Acinetobacter sp.]MCH7307495.1 hypothetical protein [Acinetobacter sp. NIPH 1852]